MCSKWNGIYEAKKKRYLLKRNRYICKKEEGLAKREEQLVKRMQELDEELLHKDEAYDKILKELSTAEQKLEHLSISDDTLENDEVLLKFYTG